MKYLFYDIIASGPNPDFDQILQFEAILADSQLEKQDNYSFKIQLRTDISPDPETILINRINFQEKNSNCSDYSSAVEIHGILNQPDTINIGYNNLKVNDVFLQNTFYRNLLEPYDHHIKNGCMRADLLYILMLYSIYSPTIFRFPYVRDKLCLKIEEIYRFNFSTDINPNQVNKKVPFLFEIAKHLFSYDPILWSKTLSYFDKRKDKISTTNNSVIVKKLGNNLRTGVSVDMKNGSDNDFVAPVLILNSDVNHEDLIIRLDESDFSSNHHTINQIYKKKYGEPGFIIPFDNNTKGIIGENKLEIARKNITWMKNNLNFLNNLKSNINQDQISEDDIFDIDSKIYLNKFDSQKNDISIAQNYLKELSKTSYKHKKKRFPDFKNIEIEIMFKRIIFRNFEMFSKNYLYDDLNKFLHNHFSKKFYYLNFRRLHKRKPQEVIILINKLLLLKKHPNERKLLLNLKFKLLDNFQNFMILNQNPIELINKPDIKKLPSLNDEDDFKGDILPF